MKPRSSLTSMTSALISVVFATSIRSQIFDPIAAQRFTYKPRNVSGVGTSGAGGRRMESGSGGAARRVSAAGALDFRDLPSLEERHATLLLRGVVLTLQVLESLVE